MRLNSKLLTLLMPLSYVVMIVCNAAASILPINGLNTAQVSDSFPNLFAPAGITFSIWGVIYLLLGVYLFYQLINRNKFEKSKIFSEINTLFVITNVLNATWIFFWQYKIIWVTVLLTTGLLLSLIKIAHIVDVNKFTKTEKRMVKIPFGVYFGWVTIATIANIVVFLVSIGWNRFGIADSVWMILVLFVGVIISALTMVKNKNLAYGLVPVWAYLGILMKHTSAVGFNYAYPQVIIVLLFCLVVLIGFNSYLVISKKAL